MSKGFRETQGVNTSWLIDHYVSGQWIETAANHVKKRSKSGSVFLREEIYSYSAIDAMCCDVSCLIIDYCHRVWNIDCIIKFVYVNDDDIVNASATRISNNNYLITLYSGLLLQVLELASSSFSDNELLSIFSRSPLSSLIEDSLPGYHSYERDSIIEQLKFAAVYVMVGNIILHECGHIINGHLNFMTNAQQPSNSLGC